MADKTKILIATLLVCILAGCGYGNRDYVKAHAAETWEANGFQVVGYHGYELGGVVPFTGYGGAYVWYTLKKQPDNGIIYTGALQRWGDEIHVYSLKAKDAIQP